VLEQERSFLERLVTEIKWPKLLPIMNEPIEAQVRTLLLNSENSNRDSEAFEFSVHFLTNAYCYYLMDYIYQKKHRTDQELSEVVHSLAEMMNTTPVLHKMEHRMVG
jgi:hypothetical protein